MKIVSVIPECFQEWSEEVSLGLSCFSCNFKCFYCHMQDIIYDQTKIIGEAKDLLLKHVNPMHSALIISGGEPTLWKDSLIELLTIAKGLNIKTKVFSNAFNYEVIYSLNNLHLVDMYSFDVKAAYNLSEVIGVPISDEEYLESLYSTMFNCFDHKVPFELRHTMAPGINTDAVKKLLADAEKEKIKIHYQKCVNYEKSSHLNSI